MPVLVTGATGVVGRALVPSLLATGSPVRVYVRREPAELRAIGAKVGIGDADDEGRLESALEQVHTIVHLVGGPVPARGETADRLNLESTRTALRAAGNAEVRRFLFLSAVGADPGSPNAYLAAKGQAEEAVRESGLEHAIFRCAPIIGPGSRLAGLLARFRSAPVALVPGRGTQRLNPIAVEDVAEALLRADTRDAELRGTWELGGPEVVTFDELVARVAGRRIVHPRWIPGVPRPLAALYALDAVADPAEAVRQFALSLTPLEAALAATGTGPRGRTGRGPKQG